MSLNNKNCHLTLEERRIILEGIQNGSHKSAIAETLGKDKSTIGKEIKLHRVRTHKFSLPLECAVYQKCKYGRVCESSCPGYRPFHCSRRDRSPGACNGCSNWSHCHFDKFRYDPDQADDEYHKTLVDSRQGVNLTEKEAEKLAAAVRPLLDQGLSPYQIIKIHPELGISEKTLYNYIDWGVFSSLPDNIRITNMDLRRKVSRKMPKKVSSLYKKRESKAYLHGREYKDYKAFIAENPDTFVTQMDTVYNDVINGPFLQTFKFVKAGFLFAIYHDTRTAQDMTQGVDLLYRILGPEVFQKYCSVILTDRGPEFSDADGMEKGTDGIQRTRIYYCDAMAAGQKGTLENKHRELRYILPHKEDLRAIGLNGQEDLNLVLSHINSAPQESLNGRSPFEMMHFLCPDLYDKFIAFGLTQIEKDKVILKPYLLKK